MEIPYELLINYCRKKTSFDENKQIEQWLSDKQNSILFEELKKEWQYIDDENIVFPDKSIVLKKVLEKINNNKNSTRKTKYFKIIIPAAAIVTILVLSSVLFFFNDSKPPIATEQFTTISTSSNEKLDTELSDGTIVWLNSNTSLTFGDKYNSENREISLDGEVFIDVKPSDKPFYLITDVIRIEVTGTSFNIRAFENDESIKIELTNGSIRIINLINNQKLVDMEAPQNLEINKKDMSYELNKNNMSASNIWMNENLIIYNEPLKVVMDKLEKWYGVDIYYKGLDTTKNYTFQIENEDLYEFLEFFSFITPIDYNVEGKDLYIENKNK